MVYRDRAGKGMFSMSLGFQLFQEQTQRLVMTTQMQQAIELLQCSTAELNEYMAQWVEGNPFAEYEPVAHQLNDPWQTSTRRPRKAGRRESATSSILEQTVPTEVTLRDKIDDQLRVADAPAFTIQVARYLLGCLDESGYLRESGDTVRGLLGVSEDAFQSGLALLQSCDPVGVGGRNLAECLRLQLHRVDPDLRTIVAAIINHHLDDIAAGKLPIVAKHLRIETAVVQRAVDALRKLNPRPGLAWASERPAYVIPDILVKRVEEDYVVITNEHAEPRLRINQGIHWMQADCDKTTRDFLQKKLQAAQWLVRCLEQRRITLYRVAEAIVHHQHAFFDCGVTAMKPLTLRQIADDVELHESTVSRAVKGKYMLTPRGLYEMRQFFSAEIPADNGVTSAKAAKHAIRAEVDAEDGRCPLSDAALTHLLDRRGIRISRRTVAKYREELKIPPSWRRRRYD